MKKENASEGLKEKVREFRQDLIIKAARAVFGQKTFDKVSMAEIAKATGMGKSSIYTYFKSQEELYVKIASQDSEKFLEGLKGALQNADGPVLKTAIQYFLDHYIANESQWKMVTHLALHGNMDMHSIEMLNDVSRQLMDTLEQMFLDAGCKTDSRLMAHTLFSSLSGILISFRKYPGRSEKERIDHMKRIGEFLETILQTYIVKR